MTWPDMFVKTCLTMVKKYNFLDTLKKHGYVVVDEGNLLNHVHNLNLVHSKTDGNHG